MNCVIIGSGWLGLPLAEKLAKQEFLVTLTYRTSRPVTADNISIEQFSGFEVSPSLQGQLKTAEIVFFVFPPPKDGSSHSEVCLNIVQHTSSTCRFVFTSTTGVYPNDEKSYTEEMIPAIPSVNKHLQTEFELRGNLRDQLTVVRLAGLVGGNRFPVRNMSLSGKTYNGSERVNLIHQNDAVRVLEFIAKNRIEARTLNACSLEHPTKQEYYTWMAKQLGIESPRFEKGPTGKTIQSDLLLSFGFKFERPDPYKFL